MPHGYSKASVEEINEVVTKLCKLYPDISKENHEMIANFTYDNYFSKEGMFLWYERTASKLTPKILDEIKIKPHAFFNQESHMTGESYTPLADR